jgi:hypothetical protein
MWYRVTECTFDLSPALTADVLKTWVYKRLENMSSYKFVRYWSAGSEQIPARDVKTRILAGCCLVVAFSVKVSSNGVL